MKLMHRTFATIFLIGSFGFAHAQEDGLQIGDDVPAFVATSDSGEDWALENHVGQEIIVVYFYPAAMTGGCTKQACAFRDHKSQLGELGASVVGVSGDEPDGLRAFKGAHNLNFPLLSDADGEIADVFGVPRGEGGSITRTIDGQEVELNRGVTTSRWTFVIGLDGKLAYRNTEVNPERDSADVIEFISGLSQSE